MVLKDTLLDRTTVVGQDISCTRNGHCILIQEESGDHLKDGWTTLGRPQVLISIRWREKLVEEESGGRYPETDFERLMQRERLSDSLLSTITIEPLTYSTLDNYEFCNFFENWKTFRLRRITIIEHLGVLMYKALVDQYSEEHFLHSAFHENVYIWNS